VGLFFFPFSLPPPKVLSAMSLRRGLSLGSPAGPLVLSCLFFFFTAFLECGSGGERRPFSICEGGPLPFRYSRPWPRRHLIRTYPIFASKEKLFEPTPKPKQNPPKHPPQKNHPKNNFFWRAFFLVGKPRGPPPLLQSPSSASIASSNPYFNLTFPFSFFPRIASLPLGPGSSRFLFSCASDPKPNGSSFPLCLVVFSPF